MYVAGVPCHVIQRGNNREACFFADEDYSYYLECLKDACDRYRVSCYAYVLMTNHTHLVLSPEKKEGISMVMQSLGRRYVQYVNKRYRRCGTLWESRHKASLIDAENYLLSCFRYIELNPVMAKMVEHPGDYQWSSYRYHANGIYDKLLKDHSIYLNLALDKQSIRRNYRELFDTVLTKDLLHKIRVASDFSMPLGNARFKEQIEHILERSIGYQKRGRPKKIER